MFCKTCDYPLWNIAARQCPECGAAFKPSEFEFTPSAVRFCCPHCEQPYFGTDERGHLVPREFDCVKCGTRVSMDEMLLLPAEGVPEEKTRAGVVPWLRRKKIGFWRGWLGTIGMSMVSPRRLIRGLPVEGQSRPAFWFAILTNFCFYFVGVALGWIGFMLIGALASGQTTGFLGGLALIVGFMTLVPLLFFALILFVWALIVHGLLRLTGPTRFGPRRTFDALCYANGANILAAIPCLGVYAQVVSWIWSGVSATIMLSETHRVSAWRAALAVFLPPVTVFAAGIAVFFMVLAGITGSITTRGVSVHSSAANVAAQAVLDWAARNNGEPPPHAAFLVADGTALPSEFAAGGFAAPAEMTVAGVDISRMLSLTPDERMAAAERIAASMPPDVIAHRVGGIVFTYHGMTFPPDGSRNPNLWILLARDGTLGGYVAVNAVGVHDWFAGPDLDARLAAQNIVRTNAGLPPLPDPRTILADSPAVRPSSGSP